MGGMWTYLLAVFLNCGNLFLQVYFAVMYVDLESDYINPIELCQKLNQVSIRLDIRQIGSRTRVRKEDDANM